ncbi:helix-turn-helix domain-containing protein [Bacillus thuringiensis]|nr:helix-turn-helix domain-containing protein [Bacillus thuringiensis]
MNNKAYTFRIYPNQVQAILIWTIEIIIFIGIECIIS